MPDTSARRPRRIIARTLVLGVSTLVAASLLIATFASYVALDLAKRVRAPDLTIARSWWAGGSIAMGTGIWAMHFVGMFAYSLPIELGYRALQTFLSWIAAVAVSGVALALAARGRLSLRRLTGGALLMGLGICAMHYTGMAALDMAPGIVWDLRLVAASALALGLAGCSLGISPDSASPHSEFKAPVAFKDAYDAVIRQSNACLRSTDNAYRVVSDLNESAQTGVVRVLAPYSDREMSRVDLKSLGPKSTDVRVVMWGKGTWDAAAMRAMQDAVYYGLVSCSTYMPLASISRSASPGRPSGSIATLG